MPLYVKDPEVVRLTEDLARRRGISKTEVIRQALRNEIAREAPPEKASDYVKKVMAAAQTFRAKGNPAKGLPAGKVFCDHLCG